MYAMRTTAAQTLCGQLESILRAEGGKLTRQVELIVNQGGVKNRDVSPGGKAALKGAFRDYAAAVGRPPSTMTGRIVCNFAEGRLNGITWNIEPYRQNDNI